MEIRRAGIASPCERSAFVDIPSFVDVRSIIGRQCKGSQTRASSIVETRRARGLCRDSPSAERVVWRQLSNRQLGGWKFTRQEPVGPYFADFDCREKKLIVEIDGAMHSTDEELARDGRRTAFFLEQGYRVMRITNAAVFENIDGVLEEILTALMSAERRSSPLPAPSRGEAG